MSYLIEMVNECVLVVPFSRYLQQRPLILELTGNCGESGRPRLLPADTEHDLQRATKTQQGRIRGVDVFLCLEFYTFM